MMLEPTPIETEQGSIVQAEVIELLDRLRREGVAPTALLGGLAAGAAATVRALAGPDAVVGWFAAQSALAMQLRD